MTWTRGVTMHHLACRLLCLLCLCCLVLAVRGQGYVNVAPGKSYSQSSKWSSSDSSSWAANGNTNNYYVHNCIHSGNNDNNPWWQVDLGRIYPVYNITIWSRNTQESRLYPANITVDSQTCASIDDFPRNSRRLEVLCHSVMYGQRVRITRHPGWRTDKYLNMCEMQIWVPADVSYCPAGRYGGRCNLKCNDHCGKGPGKNFCHLYSGQCYDGCVAGWYGDQCSTACSPGCANNQCDEQTGRCGPCTHPYTGDRCTGCQNGYYKSDSGGCDRCGANCQSQGCDSKTGRCHGCIDGYYGRTCNLSCQPRGCGQCEQDTGQCQSCSPNSFLMPPQCIECQDGYHDSNGGTCDRCSDKCQTQSCDKHTGNCQGCVDGRYGPKCTKFCPWNCAKCEQATGVCTQCTLNSHLKPPSCTDCVDGYFKSSGSLQCSECTWSCQSGTVCDKTTGHCPVCPPGKQGHHCDEDCDAGRYGQNCTESCGHCQLEGGADSCHPATGQCTHGCQDGWKPPLCQQGVTRLHFSSLPEDNAVVYACAENTVSLPWTINMSPGDTILDVQWFSEGHSHDIIATLANNVFFASPTYAGRVKRTTNAGIQISHVTTLETGNYSVEVIVHQADGEVVRLRHVVFVHIADSLQTSDGQLHLSQQPQLHYNQSTAQLQLVLSCGQFVYPTYPPFQVTWSTPTGAQNSSAFKEGHFLLHLPNPPQGGVYNCTVPPALACLHGNTGQASLTLDPMEARMRLMEGEQALMRKRTSALEKQNKELQSEVNRLTDLSKQAVSFHARMRHSLQLPKDSIVVLSEVVLNQGLAYDSGTGIFTAPYNGTYFFLASTEATTSGLDSTLSLRVDGVEVDYLWVTSDALTKAGGVQAVVGLGTGQRVWLQSTLNSSYWSQPSAFSGFLLHHHL